MPSSMEDLLSEEILEWITSLCSRGSLAALCATSKKLHRIALPHLYSEVVFNQGKEWDDWLIHLLPFAHLIFTSPLHASMVKSLVLPNDVGMEQEEIDADTKLDANVRPWPGFGTKDLETVLKNKCTEYGIDEQDANDMYGKIASGLNSDAIFALLLVNLPNLQKLDLNMGMAKERPDLIAMLERVGQRTKPFDKIPEDLNNHRAIEESISKKAVAFSRPLEVMVKFNTDKLPEDPRHLGSFFNLPFLRSIYTFMTGDDIDTNSNNPLERLKPHSCAVEYIELRRSKIHKDNLQRLMDATIPGKLKTFNYEVGNTWAWCSVEHPAIMKSLEAHHDTLESLGLSHEDFYPYQFDNDLEEIYPVSFTSFKNLKRLKVAPVYIWGHDGFHEEQELKKRSSKEMLWKALPSSLEELWLHRAQQSEVFDKKATTQFVTDCLIPALERVIQNKAAAFPALKNLRIEFELQEWRTEWLDLLASFCSLAEENGVRCKIVLTGKLYRDGKWDRERGWGWYEDVKFDKIELNQDPVKDYVDAREEEDLVETFRKLKADLDKKEEIER